MAYLDSQKQNIKLIVESLNNVGIKNSTIQAAILATVSKESNFKPQSENLNYSAKRIRQVWSQIDAPTAEKLSNNPKLLGNYVYADRYGNCSSDGYLYRGRGFNQITFKDNYKKYGDQLNIDLVSNPDLLNSPKIAASALALFFKNELAAGTKNGSFKKFGVTDPTTLNDTTLATKVAIQINAGRGTNFNNSTVQHGYTAALNVVDELKNLITSKPIATGGTIVAVIAVGCLFYFFSN